MKTNRFFLFLAAAFGLMCSACMDGDWEAPQNSNPPYGNNNLDTTNIVSIAQLKAMYPGYAADMPTLMDQEAQLKVYVTGNDIQDNLHYAIAVQDEAGDALIIDVAENALHGYLPVGQEIIINTKGLYIGGYRQQPQIGYPYTNAAGNTNVSRMSSTLWQEHFKLLPTKHEVIPMEFTPDIDINTDCGKLITIRNVSIEGADGEMKWAPESEASNNAVARFFDGMNHKFEIYTSTYSDFANAIVPTGLVNITGIWKRFNDTWEIAIRSEDDIEIVGHNDPE